MGNKQDKSSLEEVNGKHEDPKGKARIVIKTPINDNKDPKDPVKYKKVAIPKRTRDLTWVTHNGKVFESPCWSCNDVITVFNFEAGHIQAERTGGETNINNLRPVCSGCNRSMGTRNMREFAVTQGYKGRIVI